MTKLSKFPGKQDVSCSLLTPLAKVTIFFSVLRLLQSIRLHDIILRKILKFQKKSSLIKKFIFQRTKKFIICLFTFFNKYYPVKKKSETLRTTGRSTYRVIEALINYQGSKFEIFEIFETNQ